MSMSSRQVMLPGDGLLQLARGAAATPLKLLQTPTGKRLMLAAALAGVLQAGVAHLYDHADTPQMTPAAMAAPAPAGTADPAQPAAQPAEQPAGPEAPAQPADKPVRRSPEQAAIAFYAAELGLEENRVRSLAQQRVNDNTVRVLLMAERGQEQLPTRLIQVNRTQSGWRVP
jgi:hypothetical protein